VEDGAVVITEVDVYGYDLRYAHGEYVMSGGRAATTQAGTVVRLGTDDGVAGWGESTPLGGTYLPASAAGVRSDLIELGPHLLGVDARAISGVHRVMDTVLLGGGYAKSAIDVACWDILGRTLGVPICALLGGALQESFPLYEAVPLGSPESMAGFVSRRREDGVERFQLKVGGDPRADVARARAAVSATGPEAVVVADANGGWSVLDARIAMRQMRDLPVVVEQPCRTLADCAALAAASNLPLSMDESIVTADDVFRAREAAGVAAINIKISRVGGLTNAARMRDLLQDLGIMVSVEDTWGGDIITAAVSHLAASTRPESLLMTSFFNDWTDGHLAGHHPRSQHGRGSAPLGPGLGIEVDAGVLGEPLASFRA
jgi:L-alanine-DL-glutamate epimerase-like enolase superfamily enzyme